MPMSPLNPPQYLKVPCKGPSFRPLIHPNLNIEEVVMVVLFSLTVAKGALAVVSTCALGGRDKFRGLGV